MLFNSSVFLFAFLPVTFLVFWLLQSRNSRYIWLTLTGYVFYGYWNPKFCALMLFSTLVSYFAGLGFLRWDHDERIRKLLLWVPIIVDLALLGFFKYADFAISTANWGFAAAGLEHSFPMLNILLPIGISFYTFHTITYIADSWRRDIRPTRNFFEFACYVSLFSQLVAGPIVRFRELQEDLEQIDKHHWSDGLQIGWSFFIIGLAQKMLIADPVAAVIDPAFRDVPSLSTWGAWLCMLGYTYQIYFDFAGYSNMAVGLGHMFGMRIPQNFNSPYKALNPSDFWRRWHISLSRCLRDYLYIPLGGSRGGETRTYVNLVVTMLLGGLWHGASWTFVVWGAYHGLLLAAYRFWAPVWDAQPVLLQRGVTFLLAVIGWVFFRAATWSDATGLLSRMFLPHGGREVTGALLLTVMVLIASVIAHTFRNSFEMRHEWRPVQVAAFGMALILCLIFMYGGQVSPFLYFQF